MLPQYKMQTPFKIIIDSRAASRGSSNNFALTLPEAIQLDKDCVMFVSQASVSNSFLSVGATLKRNRYFYWFERIAGNATVFNRAELPARHYVADELASELQTALNNASWFGTSAAYTAVYSDQTQSITVSRPSGDQRSFVIPNNGLLANPAFQALTNPRTGAYNAYTVNWNDPESVLGLFGLDKGSSAGMDLSALTQLMANTDLLSSQSTGRIDVRQLHNVYIRSFALANNHCIGPSGARTLLQKIPVVDLPGNVLHRSSAHQMDYIDVSGRQLSTLDFFVTDFEGNDIDLRGGCLSLELLFVTRPI